MNCNSWWVGLVMMVNMARYFKNVFMPGCKKVVYYTL
jgi:hypothetical protein